MEITDCGDGTFEITETVSEINARAVAAGFSPPIVIIEMPRYAKDLALCTKLTAEEARLRGITPNVL